MDRAPVQGVEMMLTQANLTILETYIQQRAA
jgi:hypothetical protein